MSTTPLSPSARAVVTPAPAVTSSLPDLLTSEERWNAWQAKGLANDRAFQRKLAIAAPIAAVIAAAVLYALAVR